MGGDAAHWKVSNPEVFHQRIQSLISMSMAQGDSADDRTRITDARRWTAPLKPSNWSGLHFASEYTNREVAVKWLHENFKRSCEWAASVSGQPPRLLPGAQSSEPAATAAQGHRGFGCEGEPAATAAQEQRGFGCEGAPQPPPPPPPYPQPCPQPSTPQHPPAYTLYGRPRYTGAGVIYWDQILWSMG